MTLPRDDPLERLRRQLQHDFGWWSRLHHMLPHHRDDRRCARATRKYIRESGLQPTGEPNPHGWFGHAVKAVYGEYITYLFGTGPSMVDVDTMIGYMREAAGFSRKRPAYGLLVMEPSTSEAAAEHEEAAS